MYLTFDAGTTSVKTALYDRQGRLIRKVIKDYRLSSPHVDWYEVDPEIYWNAVLEGFSETIKASGVQPASIKTISGCSQGETVILLDREGNALRPAIVWYDNRARKEVEELRKVVSTDEFYGVTGIPDLEPTWSAMKLLWVKNNEKEVFTRLARVLLVEDFITYRLTGRAVSTPSLLSTSALIDIHTKTYWDKTVDYIGIRDKLPEIVEEGSIVGAIRPEVARATGLGSDVIVVKGSMDQNTSAIGAGNTKPGIITETTGSTLALCVTAKLADIPKGAKLPYQPHALPDTYLLVPFALTAGIVYKWFRDAFAREEINTMKDLDAVYGKLNEMAETVPPGCEGIIILPFLAGASFPENDTCAKGVFYGLTLKHGRAHIARAIMESIAFMLKKILLAVVQSGISVEEIRSMGGGARSGLWLQIKADVCGSPIVRMEVEETSTLGAAILASVRAGNYSSVDEAVRAIVKPGKRFIPDGTKEGLYAKAFALYSELYDSLKPLFKKYG